MVGQSMALRGRAFDQDAQVTACRRNHQQAVGVANDGCARREDAVGDEP